MHLITVPIFFYFYFFFSIFHRASFEIYFLSKHALHYFLASVAVLILITCTICAVKGFSRLSFVMFNNYLPNLQFSMVLNGLNLKILQN